MHWLQNTKTEGDSSVGRQWLQWEKHPSMAMAQLALMGCRMETGVILIEDFKKKLLFILELQQQVHYQWLPKPSRCQCGLKKKKSPLHAGLPSMARWALAALIPTQGCWEKDNPQASPGFCRSQWQRQSRWKKRIKIKFCLSKTASGTWEI